MRKLIPCTFLVLIIGALPILAQSPLTSGRLTTVVFPEVVEPTLFNGEDGFFIDVPANAVSLVLDLTTSPPEANIDLFARFGEDVQEDAEGEIIADYRSEGPLGEERIVITLTSVPPLSVGRYFVAMTAGFRNPQTFGFLRPTITSGNGGPQATAVAVSDFEASEDGWTWNHPEPDPTVPGFTLGSPDSELRLRRESETTRFLELTSDGDADSLVAPSKFLGKLAVLGPNARLEFELRFRSESFPRRDVEVRVLGASTVYSWSAGDEPDRTFLPYVVPLDEGLFERITGTASFAEVLDNVLRIEVRANFGDPDGATSIDNFRLLGDPATPLVPVRSMFEGSVEGWTRNFPDAPFLVPRAEGVTTGDARTTITLLAAGGNPDGYLLVNDADDMEQDFLVAPDEFLGDLGALGAGAAFEFDRLHDSAVGAVRPAEVRVIGFGSAYRFSPAPAGRDWTHYVAPLDPAMWSLVAGTGSFEDTIRAVQRIEVSVDDVANLDEVNGLDNFALVVSQAPGPQLSATPDSLRFIAVSGEAPPPGQAVDLTSDGDPVSWVAAPLAASPWVVLSETEGSTPATLVVSVNPAGLDLGGHTGGVEIASAGSTDPLIVVVNLTIVTPTAPLINTTGVVNNADFTPNAQPGGELTGGMYVAIFGQKLADTTEQVSSVPFPNSLGAASVTFNGLPAPMVFASPTQLVAVAPQALTQGTGSAAVAQAMSNANVVVNRGGEASPLEAVRLAAVRPVLFTQNNQGTGLGSIQNVFGSGGVQLNDFDNPAQPGQAVQIFATGLGPTEQPVPDGQAATGINSITGTARVSIGGMIDDPLFAGLSPGSPHLYQVNAVVPANSPLGCSVPVKVIVDGVESNEVSMAVSSDGEPCR